jgi:hypothetical protein
MYLQLSDKDRWTGSGYEIVRPQTNRGPLAWSSNPNDATSNIVCWHYIHTLEMLIGGLCSAGFVIYRLRKGAILMKM